MQIDSVKRYRRLERQHPIFSPVALISTFILAVGLGVGVYTTGGRAFSPGELSAINHSGTELEGVINHAAILDDCGQCHEPFVGITAERCESCHIAIAAQREDDENLHGRLPEAGECEICHLEHRGSEYDLKTTAIADFDHGITKFSVAKHALDYDGLAMDCQACHLQKDRFIAESRGCANCHGDENRAFIQEHNAAFGKECLACHDGHDSLADFTLQDHMEVFTLNGSHLEVSCETCHEGGEFAGLPRECAGCHREPALHLGLFSSDCEGCHITVAWVPAEFEGFAFDHESSTSFSLITHETDYDGTTFSCRSCHLPDQSTALEDGRCVDCHKPAAPVFMNEHIDQFGLNCQSCHDGSGQMANFDHNNIWPLEGHHLVQKCEACHADKVFSGTPRECVACHEEPQIHLGVFGLTCDYCHISDAWLPARLRQHKFPLDHGEQGLLDCSTCHIGASYTVNDCTTCHEHNSDQVESEHAELDITTAELYACATCHPTGLVEE